MTSRMRSVDISDFKPNVKWMFNDLKCTEEDFVRALSYLRKHHSKQYHKIDIPSRWDGCAHLVFPQVFIEGNEVEVEALYSFGRFWGEHEEWIESKVEEEKFILPKAVALRLIKKGMVKMINYE